MMGGVILSSGQVGEIFQPGEMSGWISRLKKEDPFQIVDIEPFVEFELGSRLDF